MDRAPGEVPKKPPEKEAPKGHISRREMMRGLFLSTLTSALKPDTADAQGALSSWRAEVHEGDDLDRMLDRGGHMSYFKEQLRAYQRKVRSVAHRRDFSGSTVAEAGRAERMLLQDQPPCFYDMLNAETKRQIESFSAKRTVWLSRVGNSRIVEARPMGLVNESLRQSTIQESRYRSAGQATLMRSGRSYFLQTNMHVLAGMDPRYAENRNRLGHPDVAFYSIRPETIRSLGMNPEDAVDIDAPQPEGFELHGSPVMTWLFDPDHHYDTGPRIPKGHKSFFGIATEGTWTQALAWIPPQDKAIVMNSYMFRADSGEADIRRMPGTPKPDGQPTTIEFMFAGGTSGGGVESYYKGHVHFVGTITTGWLQPFQQDPEPTQIPAGVPQKRDASIITFYGRAQIRAALRDQSRIFPFEQSAEVARK